MPVNDGSDIGQLEFRNPQIRQFSRRIEDTGTPFWRMVGAVFMALVLYGILEALVALLMARYVARELESELVRFQDEFSPAAVMSSRPQAAQPVLPAYPGPIAARKAGDSQACIGGYVSNRVQGGWSQTRQRCRASSQ